MNNSNSGTTAITLILMGVTGSGKSTIGKILADTLSWPFYDGDDFHPPQNKAKMSTGTPLTDSDRSPWLRTLNELLLRNQSRERSCILACSALKKSYRDILAKDISAIRFVHLDGPFACIQERLEARTGHFMNPVLLNSQLETLERTPDVLCVSIDSSPGAISESIIRRLSLQPAG
jgi:carbohydrate kinase (thermoresistant glucokinase family)